MFSCSCFFSLDAENLRYDSVTYYQEKAIGLYRKSAWKEAISTYSILTKYDSLPVKAQAYLNIALCYRKMNQKDSSRINVDRSVNILNRLPPSYFKYNSLLKSGILFKNYGYYESAIEQLTIAYKGFTEISNDAKKATLCNILAETHRLIGNQEMATRYYHENLSLSKLIGDSLKISNSYNALGNLHKSLDQSDSAIFYYKEAIHLQESTPTKKELGRKYHNLGTVYYKDKNYNLAEKNFLDALALKSETEDYRSLPYTLNELAMLAVLQNKNEEAESYLKKSFQHIGSISNQDVVARYHYVHYRYLKSLYKRRKHLQPENK